MTEAEFKRLLAGIKTEIGAGMVLFPHSAEERAHNNACERANLIIQNYIDGYGLFQLVKPTPQTGDESEAAGREAYRRATEGE